MFTLFDRMTSFMWKGSLETTNIKSLPDSAFTLSFMELYNALSFAFHSDTLIFQLIFTICPKFAWKNLKGTNTGGRGWWKASWTSGGDAKPESFQLAVIQSGHTLIYAELNA